LADGGSLLDVVFTHPIAGAGGEYSAVTPAMSTLFADGAWTSTVDCGRSVAIRLPFSA
jgi:hypothetical protein